MHELAYRLKMGTKMVTGSNETKLVWKMRQHVFSCHYLVMVIYSS